METDLKSAAISSCHRIKAPKRKKTVKKRKLHFEPIEPRLLLDADPTETMDDSFLDNLQGDRNEVPLSWNPGRFRSILIQHRWLARFLFELSRSDADTDDLGVNKHIQVAFEA